MTQEEKQLLIKDLCARLPFGVRILDIPANVVGDPFLVSTTDIVEYEPVDEPNDDTGYQTLYNIKLYLRPMSSMTKEEFDEYMRFIKHSWEGIDKEEDDYYVKVKDRDVYIDWLNEHHFDYRGLIPMGLALEALEGMYKFE